MQQTNQLAVPSPSEVAVVGKQIKLLEYVEAFILKARAGQLLTHSGELYKKTSVSNYISFRNRFADSPFAEAYLYEVDDAFCDALKLYFVQKFSKNSVAGHLARFKRLVRLAYRERLIDRLPEVSNSWEKTTAVYLTGEELLRIKNANNLTSAERNVADRFLIQSLTGMRYSDLRQFLANPLLYLANPKFIDINSEKANVRSVIPVHPIVRELLTKHEYRFEPRSSQLYNRLLKNVCMKVGIDTPVPVYRTVGGRKQLIEQKKYELVSSHTARRTFATRAYLSGIPSRNIMLITGHLAETSFNHYIRIGEVENAEKLQNHEFFQTL